MCRLFAFRSAIQSQVHQSLVHAENALLRQSEKHPDGWGIAYYQAEAPHLIKSAQTACHDKLYHQVSAIVSSHTVLAHIRKATVGDPSFVNAHPFQYGRWVFAHNGRIAHFDRIKSELLARIDPALRLNILGDTDSECFFFLILTHLSHITDLHDPSISLQEIAAAAQLATRDILELAGTQETFLTFILTDGGNMLAHQGGKELHVSVGDDIRLSSEPLQDANDWTALKFGEFLGVDSSLRLMASPLIRRAMNRGTLKKTQ